MNLQPQIWGRIKFFCAVYYPLSRSIHLNTKLSINGVRIAFFLSSSDTWTWQCVMDFRKKNSRGKSIAIKACTKGKKSRALVMWKCFLAFSQKISKKFFFLPKNGPQWHNLARKAKKNRKKYFEVFGKKAKKIFHMTI